MIRRGFLNSESRKDPLESAWDGSAAHRLARRANAMVLFDDGMTCDAIAKVFLLDNDAIRTWCRLALQKRPDRGASQFWLRKRRDISTGRIYCDEINDYARLICPKIFTI